ncbi:PREDICTED: uncharacterized protein LOC104592935 [Nelumbo nucifera]|uniref:Uncharacterized protein LOC104592935 n=2 Tax=Nelumbo nucifera TaxID=4432 RepID=A0A1U7ZB81_NELNU|nr:PREDICTED: uncharacterized protein LOC104592935 [Nelumbo nucifera]XP_010250788.1 PREDICTED: uncharacterized protein LOC104592935 [Nelumbo nucifera]DAD34296.1 TPA_asm: hypothetical protein HUJ06_004936 [Nelumbo nucifera]
MVLGLRTKNKRGTSVQVDYLVHLQEIKPWPPSQSLRSLRSVLLQWENGDRNSGCTNHVIPSLGSGVGDGKIEFNESFRLPVTLTREVSVKGGDAETFQKNCLEFNLYEPRRDKTVKGQLLGTVIIDLAEYGIVKETVCISVPMNCKRSFRNTAQPVLFVKIQPFERSNSSSLQRERLSKEVPSDKDGKESVSVLMTEEYAEEAEIASFTDDDVSSHSSLTTSSSTFDAAGSSPLQNEENASESVKNGVVSHNEVAAVPLEKIPAKPEVKTPTTPYTHLKGSLPRSSSVNLSSDLGSPENGHASLSNFQQSLASTLKTSIMDSDQSSSSAYESVQEEVTSSNSTKNLDQDEKVIQEITNVIADKASSSNPDLHKDEKAGLVTIVKNEVNEKDDGEARENIKDRPQGGTTINDQSANCMGEKDGEQSGENGEDKQIEKEKNHSTEDEAFNRSSLEATRKQVASGSNTITFSGRSLGMKGNIQNIDRLKHVKSVRSPLESSRSNGFSNGNQLMEEVKEVDSLEDTLSGSRNSITAERNNAEAAFREILNCQSKVQQLEHRVESLEAELREAAAVEIGLYSVVAEHGSSVNKVHAPARRLSRLYLHACRKWSKEHRASAARSAISGLVMVAKACGNDVPRLTFWLSNSVVLRAVVSQAVGELQLPVSSGPHIESNDSKKENDKRSSLKWKDSSLNKKEKIFGLSECFDDWEDPKTFTTALEKIEAWIFSRIIESVWWQTLTPHMQPAGRASEISRGSSSGKSYGWRSSLCDEDQGNFSLDLWKRAFKDACERLCPVRAGGHECGCLPVLARLVMEQCVGRFDVAMFNAILRESADEIPTDPISDPISDSKVLPIPAGKSSFGAGAQLKNAIGNWSRWLTDLFGMDDDDSPEDENGFHDEDRQEYDTSFKSFHLLNALSDLMMLPKDMLLNRDIRKEVCPTFGAPLIRGILSNFVPDEFCPDPIPEIVLEALDSEDPLEAEEESLKNFPCNAAPIVYAPPSAASLSGFIGEVGSHSQLRRSGSSVLRKSYTSEDELDELDSPLASIIADISRVSPTSTVPSWKMKENGGRNTVRYQLLREVWRDGD